MPGRRFGPPKPRRKGTSTFPGDPGSRFVAAKRNLLCPEYFQQTLSCEKNRLALAFDKVGQFGISKVTASYKNRGRSYASKFHGIGELPLSLTPRLQPLSLPTFF